jgi:hypothetical protein
MKQIYIKFVKIMKKHIVFYASPTKKEIPCLKILAAQA